MHDMNVINQYLIIKYANNIAYMHIKIFHDAHNGITVNGKLSMVALF